MKPGRGPLNQPTKKTREQVVRSARVLMQTRSYLGFSFQDVADDVGVRKPSLYHHFPTKEALGIEVLQETLEAFRLWTRTAQKSPRAWLDAYFEMYRNTMRAGERLCPGGALVAGWDCVDDGLREAVRNLRDAQVLWLTGVLGGLVTRANEAGTLASFVYATCQGALVTARMTGRIQDFDDLIAQLNRLLPQEARES